MSNKEFNSGLREERLNETIAYHKEREERMRFDQQTEPTAFISNPRRNWKEEQMTAEKREQKLRDEMYEEDEEEE